MLKPDVEGAGFGRHLSGIFDRPSDGIGGEAQGF